MLGGGEISRATANGFAGLAHGLLATKGHSPEVERAFAGARDLCGQVGETRSFARC
jgi:hypothetical protein